MCISVSMTPLLVFLCLVASVSLLHYNIFSLNCGEIYMHPQIFKRYTDITLITHNLCNSCEGYSSLKGRPFRRIFIFRGQSRNIKIVWLLLVLKHYAVVFLVFLLYNISHKQPCTHSKNVIHTFATGVSFFLFYSSLQSLFQMPSTLTNVIFFVLNPT